MAISDRVRKILWGRSGNRCAVCRQELVVDATSKDDESVVGEECHIVSGREHGPRHDPTFSTELRDEPENLVLLCRIHHKMVDDQKETYTVDVLRTLKTNHEMWVASALTSGEPLPRPRFRRVKGNVPEYLTRLTSGRHIMTILGGACVFSFEHDEPGSDAEVNLLADFLQEAQDWGDMSGDLEAGDHVRAAFRMSTLLGELEQAGFWVFGGREVQLVEGGVVAPAPWPVAIIRVLRSTSPEITYVDVSDGGDEQGKQTQERCTPTVQENDG
jgi:hypothetical protein